MNTNFKKQQPTERDIDFQIDLLRWLFIFGPIFDKGLDVDRISDKMDELLDLKNKRKKL